MKRIFVVIALLIFTLSVSGCGGNNTPDKYTLSFVEGHMVSITVNDTSKEYVGVFCDFTNNSGQTCLPCDAINVKAFQNGKELTVVVFTGTLTEEAIQCDASVQTGTTVRVVWLFEKQDNSTVSIEFTNGQKSTFDLKIDNSKKELTATEIAEKLLESNWTEQFDWFIKMSMAFKKGFEKYI